MKVFKMPILFQKICAVWAIDQVKVHMPSCINKGASYYDWPARCSIQLMSICVTCIESALNIQDMFGLNSKQTCHCLYDFRLPISAEWRQKHWNAVRNSELNPDRHATDPLWLLRHDDPSAIIFDSTEKNGKEPASGSSEELLLREWDFRYGWTGEELALPGSARGASAGDRGQLAGGGGRLDDQEPSDDHQLLARQSRRRRSRRRRLRHALLRLFICQYLFLISLQLIPLFAMSKIRIPSMTRL